MTRLYLFAKDNCYFNGYYFLLVSKHRPDMLDETMSATLTASEGEAEGEADDDDNTTIMPETAVPRYIDGNQKYAIFY